MELFGAFLLISVLFETSSGTSRICENLCTCKSKQNSNGTSVDCSRVNLAVVPNVDDWPTFTEELDLSSNVIKALDVETKHEYLKVLKCARNKIETIVPSVFSGLTNLQHLDLSFNNLTEIPGNTFRGLSDLLSLDLSHNKIKSIDDFTFSGLLLLRDLSLSNNKIIHLQNSHWNRMYELKNIYLSGIGAYSLDANLFHKMDKLEYLDLSQNDLNQVPTMALRSARNLKRLRLNANPIEKLDKSSFLKLSTLMELEINFMINLEVVEAETFSELKNLSNLELSSNPNLRFINPDAFKGLFDKELKLKEVTLQLNKLTTLTPLPCLRLRKMNLQGNPWKCDCRMRWLKKCIISENYAANLKCDFPEEARGKLIVQTAEDVFSCDVHQSQPFEDVHTNRVVRAASLALGCLLLVLLSVLIVSVLKWRNIRTWWHNKKRGPGAVYYVRARANPMET